MIVLALHRSLDIHANTRKWMTCQRTRLFKNDIQSSRLTGTLRLPKVHSKPKINPLAKEEKEKRKASPLWYKFISGPFFK